MSQIERQTGKSGALKASFKGGKLSFEDANGNFSLKLDNRLVMDAAVHIPSKPLPAELESTPNKNLKHDDGRFRFSDGFSLRYARVALKTNFYKRWSATLDIDFSLNGVSLKDAFIAYSPTTNSQIVLGQFKEPMSIECTTSSRYLLLPERPMVIDALTTSRTAGLATVVWGRYVWFSVGGFTQPFDEMLKEKNRGSSGYAITSRIASAPVNRDIATLHFGLYGTCRKPNPNGSSHRSVGFKSYSESRVDRHRLVENSVSNVNYYVTGGAELALRVERFLLQGEYLFTSLSRYSLDAGQAKVSLPNAHFSGWYVTASYTILGSERAYMLNEAEFNQPKSNSKWGTLEVAARVSHLNLNDLRSAEHPVYGGSAMVYSAGLNYMPVPNVKLTLAYLYADHDGHANEKGNVTYAGAPLRDGYSQGIDCSTVMLRAMFSF